MSPAEGTIQPPSAEARPTLTAQAAQQLVETAVERRAVDLMAQWQQNLREIKSELETKREGDLRKISKEFQYLENLQSVVWKEAARNNKYLDTLARDLYVKVNQGGSVQ
ncbi:MAG: hypothetical protein AB1898_05200 [Acidobacteriota bacterium]